MAYPRLILALGCGLLTTGCFNPDGPSANETEGSTGATPTTGPQLTTAGGPTGNDTVEVDTTASTPDGTTSDGTSGGESSSTGGPTPCTDAGDCSDGLLCIDDSCQPCSAAADPDGECEARSGDAPVCDADAGLCVACVAETCDGMTPVCDPAVGCAACTVHADCPDSACHLMGPEQGGCFDVADVEEVSDITELEAALTIGAGSQLVINLTAETFTVGGTFSVNGEVAILGQPGTVITGGATNLFAFGGDGQYLYVADVAVDTGPFRAFNCSGAGGLWLDDTVVDGYALGVYSGCETHLRRGRYVSTDDTGAAVEMLAGGELFAENVAFGPGGEVPIRLTDATADLRYVTIAGNALSLICMGGASGTIRNSILVSPTGGSITPGCQLSFVDNAVDGGFGFGDDVGVYDPAWFVSPAVGDFHLTPAGQATFGGIADWDDGDPLLDVDGDPRPQDRAGFPGIDEVP
ncbi:MAG: hypothetical protein AAF721_36900 [Myxococcota bacterium]